ncbi:hypothetical protein CC78DRAFT_619326 [Lojkania enalia]|uniref:Uncharacterized protein n=1 Tax=Lojkania enalia TaxID=147567 RepID=A0A9P4K7L6_9PLEO|nr:hypothetical protein CC78DRAFT_619326 [Didymosphaeria enalia]
MPPYKVQGGRPRLEHTARNIQASRGKDKVPRADIRNRMQMQGGGMRRIDRGKGSSGVSQGLEIRNYGGREARKTGCGAEERGFVIAADTDGDEDEDTSPLFSCREWGESNLGSRSNAGPYEANACPTGLRILWLECAPDFVETYVTSANGIPPKSLDNARASRVGHFRAGIQEEWRRNKFY